MLPALIHPKVGVRIAMDLGKSQSFQKELIR